MRTGFFATTAFGLILLTLVAGCAIDPESRIHLTTMATFIDDDPERDVDDDMAGYHVGVGKSFGDNYKLEVTAVGGRYNADGFDADQQQAGLGLDIMRKLGSSSYFYPYAVLGLGHLRTDRLGPDGRDYSGPMISVGAGVITPFYIMGQAVRVEMRLRNDSGDTAGARYQDSLLSIGLHYPLGKPTTLRPDSDGDGVDDARDKCERTRVGAQVDKYGCARDIDSDKDGVSDAIDMCGGTQAGRVVDEYGCERSGDDDADGVPDYRDRCPGTRPGARVNEDGCPVNATTLVPRPASLELPLAQAWTGGLREQEIRQRDVSKVLTNGGPFTLSYSLSLGADRARPQQRTARL